MKRILSFAGITIMILLVLYLYLVFWRSRQPAAQDSVKTLPVEVQRLIPPGWDTSIGGHLTCDFDGDGKNEWLVAYRFDKVSVQPPYPADATQISFGPIGAAIYDAKLNSPAQGSSGSYPETSITTYRLLPDSASGKGEGYLGESHFTSVLFPPIDKDNVCRPSEIGFLGYSKGDLPTHFALFHWGGENLGYQGSLFVGNARVDAAIPIERGQYVTQVTTYNLLNVRSLLCRSETFKRTNSVSDFPSTPENMTVDFCYGAPGDPSYPEGAVVALLRGSVPRAPKDNAPMPPGNSFLMPGVELPSGLKPPAIILSVTNNAAAEPVPGGGHACTTEFGGKGVGWWCGQQAATVVTEVPVAGIVLPMKWTVISITREDVVDDMHWRISNVELP